MAHGFAWLIVVLAVALPFASGMAQQPSAVQSLSAVTPARAPSTYDLGPGDVVNFYGVDAEEIVNKPYRIGPEGQLSLPLIGRVQIGGLTIRQLEDIVNERLKAFIRDPQLVADVVEYRSQPISVVGAVNQSGTQQLQGRRTLLEMISLAGGLRQDAGYSIRITRQIEWGELPLPKASTDSTGKFSVAEVNVRDLIAGQRPTDNIPIMPHDVITVPEAEKVFVLGDVRRSGGFLLVDRQTMSVVEAISNAEGLVRTADSRNSRILRVVVGQTSRREISVDIKAVLAGKAEDIPLQSGDILFVPGSISKTIGLRTAEALVQAATGVAIWGRN